MITARILPQITECKAIIRLTFCTTLLYEKQQSRNAFIMRTVFHNVNAINASILPQGAESNASVRLIFFITLLMISNNAQMPLP